MAQRIVCVRCNKSAFVYQAIKTDPVTHKKWSVSSCSKCGFNIDLEEAKDGPKIHKEDPTPKVIYPPKPYHGYFNDYL
jgi:predicted nucleic-acid-binding Zn-ribbon protein